MTRPYRDTWTPVAGQSERTYRIVPWMPTIPQYMALAEAIHDARDECAANYVVPFSECALREFDCQDAVTVLIGLRKAGWRLERDPAGTVELGL